MTTREGQHGCDTDRLWALAVGVVTDEETRTSEEHLASCLECRGQLHTIRADVEALGCFAAEGGSPKTLAEQVLVRSQTLQARGKRLRWLALSALLVAALVGGVFAAHTLTIKALARRNLLRLEHAIERIQNSEGTYPANEEELVQALGRLGDPEVGLDPQGRPLDHWGQPFHYRYPGVQVPGLFDLWGLGANGVDNGGTRDDQTNWR
jgi:hypothetical protein